MEELLRNIERYYQQKRPFVLYALPNSDKATAMFQKQDVASKTQAFSEDGFVFAPFDEGDTLCLANSECVVTSVSVPAKKINSAVIDTDVIASEKEDYQVLVSGAIQHIHNGFSSKIVTSRCKQIALDRFDLAEMAERLLVLFPEAFRYIWYHPDSGLWCGASPEVLLTTEGNTFSTMALAGTVVYNPQVKPKWTRKALNEQQWVTDALTDKLQHAASVIKVSKVKDHRAGSLVHLRTDFTGVLKKGCKKLEALARSLHPTPAVCGTPYETAKKFIQKNEPYNRSYYTGFLGPVDVKTGHARLFVNLRCMRLENDKASVYVGGGITDDSKAEDEFWETQNKLQTMLQVLHPML